MIPWTAAHQPTLPITNSQSLLKLRFIESVMPSNHLILCCPLLLSSIFPATGSFQMSQSSHQVAKILELSFSTSPSSEYSGLISFRVDWFDLLAVQGTNKSLLQHHSSVASILHHSEFYMVLLSYPYMSTGKTIALTRWTFFDKCLSLFFNMLSKVVISFLPRSKNLSISWLKSTSAVILEPKKIKSVTVSIFFPIYLA